VRCIYLGEVVVVATVADGCRPGLINAIKIITRADPEFVIMEQYFIKGLDGPRGGGLVIRRKKLVQAPFG
jgi:hypothetical protein